MEARPDRIAIELIRSGSVVARFALAARGWRRDRLDGLWRDPSWRAIRAGRRHRRVLFPPPPADLGLRAGRHRRAE